MGFSLDEHSSNHPVILEQLWCPICLMIVSQPLELGAPCRALVEQKREPAQTVITSWYNFVATACYSS
eukprot:Em0160g3a